MDGENTRASEIRYFFREDKSMFICTCLCTFFFFLHKDAAVIAPTPPRPGSESYPSFHLCCGLGGIKQKMKISR